jgi:TPR repeat protein
MRYWRLTLGLALVGCLGVPLRTVASGDEGLQLSQSTPDMAPLLDSLREFSEPHERARKGAPPNAQALRELMHLRQQALATPTNATQRVQAGQAAWLLGLIYLHGAGVTTNPAQARQWFTLSVHYAEPMAQAGLAWCALDGCQSAANLAQARNRAQRLASVDPGRAAYFLWLIERQLHPLNPQASEGLRSQAAPQRRLLDQAVAADHVHALNALGILYAQDQDLGQALLLFERAAGRSRVARENAAWVRQRIALAQSGLPTPPIETANLSQAQATFKAARDFHRGAGIPINYAQAIRLYRQAEVQGSAPASRMLALIYSRTALDGTLDPVWMRQLSELDIGSLAPRQETAPGISALRAEPTALIDLLPLDWLQWMEPS